MNTSENYNDWFGSEFGTGTTKQQREAVSMFGYDAVFGEQDSERKEDAQPSLSDNAQSSVVLSASEGLRNYKAARATTYEGYCRLVEQLKRMDYYYYQKGEPLVSDQEYEGLRFQALAVEDLHPSWRLPDSPTSTIGNDCIRSYGAGSIPTVKHRTQMLSMAKVAGQDDGERRANLVHWYKRTADTLPMVAEWKYDGISVSLVYVDGELVEASTRGKDGWEGSNITAQVMHLDSVPKHIDAKGRTEVRGELIISDANYQALSAFDKAKTQQAQIVKVLQQTSRCTLAKEQGLEFRPWEVIGNGTEQRHTERMKWAMSQGFLSCPMRTATTWEEVEAIITDMEEEHRTTLGLPTDGIILKLDNDDDRAFYGSTAHHPKWAIAWKWSAQTAGVELLHVGKTRTGKPSLHFAPLIIDGRTIDHVDVKQRDYQNYPFTAGMTIRISIKPGSGSVQFAGFAETGGDNSNEDSPRPSAASTGSTANDEHNAVSREQQEAEERFARAQREAAQRAADKLRKAADIAAAKERKEAKRKARMPFALREVRKQTTVNVVIPHRTEAHQPTLAARRSVKGFFASHKWLKRIGMAAAGAGAVVGLYYTGLLIPIALVGLSMSGIIK